MKMPFGKRGDCIQVFVFPFCLEGFFSVSDIPAHAHSASLLRLSYGNVIMPEVAATYN